MKSPRLHLFRWLVVALALAVGGCEEKREEREVETGYRGKARQNPFLAAERFLEQSGYSVVSESRYSRRLTPGATVIAPVEAFLETHDCRRALAWAANGGHLILLLKEGEYWRSDWGIDLWEAMKKGHKEQKPMLEELGIKLTDVDSGTTTTTVNGQRLKFHIGGAFGFEHEPPAKATVSVGPPKELGLYSYRSGRGRITLVASAHPFRNRYIGDADHAGLLHSLVKMSEPSTVIFLRALRNQGGHSWFQPEFLEKLWEQGWMALVTLAILIGFWIWKNLPRFGPAHAPEDRSARSFAENLLLAGAFLWRHRQTEALLDPIRRDIASALGNRGWAWEDARTIQELADRSGLPAERVQAALHGFLPPDGHGFQKLVQDLQTIRAKI